VQDASTNTAIPPPRQFDVEIDTGNVGGTDPLLANHIRSIIQTRVVPYLRRRQLARIEEGVADGPEGFVLIL